MAFEPPAFPRRLAQPERPRCFSLESIRAILASNRDFHSALLHDPSAFSELAGNRFRGRTYIGKLGLERHSSAHARIASEIFAEQPFENVAAVTELFFCASESSRGHPVEHSPCAEKYFERVLAIIQPQVVFAVGRRVETYLVRRYGVEALWWIAVCTSDARAGRDVDGQNQNHTSTLAKIRIRRKPWLDRSPKECFWGDPHPHPYTRFRWSPKSRA